MAFEWIDPLHTCSICNDQFRLVSNTSPRGYQSLVWRGKSPREARSVRRRMSRRYERARGLGRVGAFRNLHDPRGWAPFLDMCVCHVGDRLSKSRCTQGSAMAKKTADRRRSADVHEPPGRSNYRIPPRKRPVGRRGRRSRPKQTRRTRMRVRRRPQRWIWGCVEEQKGGMFPFRVMGTRKMPTAGKRDGVEGVEISFR